MIEKFDLEKIKNMSEEEIHSLICRGLSEVCLDLAKITDDDKYKGEFKNKAKVFKALSKIKKKELKK